MEGSYRKTVNAFYIQLANKGERLVLRVAGAIVKIVVGVLL